MMKKLWESLKSFLSNKITIIVAVVFLVTAIVFYAVGRIGVKDTSIQTYQIEEINKKQEALIKSLDSLPIKYENLHKSQQKQIDIITKKLNNLNQIEKQRYNEVNSTYIEPNDSTVEFLTRRYNK